MTPGANIPYYLRLTFKLLLLKGYRQSFFDVKRPGLEDDHSPTSSADVKKRGVTAPLQHKLSSCNARIKHKDTFNFLPQEM